VRANREIALLSHAIRWAMNKGLVELERHPFEPAIMYHKERPRTRRVEARRSFGAMVNFAREVCPPVAAVMWLMDLTGQRRVDLLALRRSAAQAEGLEVIQAKPALGC
jgi:integrase